jgi:hypothetical protein
MRFPKQIEVTGQTPEELLRNLDLQIAFLRARPGVSSRKRTTLLTALLLLLISGAGLALLALSQMLPAGSHTPKDRVSAVSQRQQ